MNVGIIGTGKYVPDKVLTNQDLEQMVETSDEWITSRTGIKERRIASAEQATSDLAVEAAKNALKSAGLTGEDVELIIVATITPDMAFPSVSCILQEKLGAKHAAAFDLSAACSGFIYALANAQALLKSGMYKNALVVGAETLSKITDYTDRNTCILFGDGAGAVVLGEVAEGRGFRSFELGADGSGGELLNLRGGGSRIPASEDSVKNKLHYIYMNGREVFKFAVRQMPESSVNVIEKAGLQKEDVDYLVPHQANIRIMEAARKRLGISEDKMAKTVQNYGNNSSASVPIALSESVLNGKIKDDDIVVLVGFGGGLTWGAIALKWGK